MSGSKCVTRVLLTAAAPPALRTLMWWARNLLIFGFFVRLAESLAVFWFMRWLAPGPDQRPK
jgi:hypothetical protein